MHALLALVLLVPPILGGWMLAARHGAGVRIGFAIALLAWNAWAVLVSELLSVQGGSIYAATLACAWVIPSVVSVAYIALNREHVRGIGVSIRAWWSTCGMRERLAASVVAVCGFLIFVTGFISAPNNWDSMSYHLTRVARWADLHDVTHYATVADPQLYQPPGAELGILQWYVLSDGDRFAFVGQWVAWIAVVLLASRAAQLLGASRFGSWAAALITATIPMAILQGSSTQNDLTLAAWLLLAATLALRVAREPRDNAQRDTTALLLAAGALGFAVLTKGTGAMLGVPVGALVLAAGVHRFGALRGMGLALVGAVILVIPNIGAWHRNIDTFGTPFATGVHGDSYRVQHPTLGTLTSNVIRNATNHLDLPGDWWNERVERGAVRLDDAIGQDANDPATTFQGQPFRVGPYGPHEDHAGSFLLLLLAPLAIVLTIVRIARRRSSTDTRWHAAWMGVVIAQALLFCALVTWQNWHARLHLPILVMFVPALAALLDAARWRKLLVAATAISVVLAPIALFGNVTRPLVGEDSILTHSRTHSLFDPRPQLRQPFEAAVRRMSAQHIRDAGIVTNVDEWQYPLMWLGRRASPRVAFEDVSTRLDELQQPDVPSGSYDDYDHPGYASNEDADARPRAIVCVSCDAQQITLLQSAGYTQRDIAGDGAQPGRGDDVASVDYFQRPITPLTGSDSD
jgi:hypothetical protein